MADLRKIVDCNVQIVGMTSGVVLVIGLRRIEHVQQYDLRHDASLEHLRIVQLVDVRPRDALLFGVREENNRTILRSDVRPLTIQLSRIVRDRKEDLQKLPIGDLRGIISNLNGLRVPAPAYFHDFITRGVCCSTRISRDRLPYALDVVEDGFDAPETTAGEDRDSIFPRAAALVGVGRWNRYGCRGFATASRENAEEQNSDRKYPHNPASIMNPGNMSQQIRFLTLDQVRPADRARVGGKAFNCARLMQAGISVPDGAVITTEADEAFLDSSQLREWLSGLPAGALLAVRSSAAEEDSLDHSFAGIHETSLNVKPDDVPAAVRSCWASGMSPMALAYRRARNVKGSDSKMAVLIQRMIQPAAAGVAFTVNPVSGSRDDLLINSVFGPGEALVSGQVQPDEFTIRKKDRETLSTHVADTKASLDRQQLRELSALLVRIEEFFGGPQDVEWCYDGRQFWIVQSRPVTSGSSARKIDIQWTRANLREVLPDMTSPMAIYSVAETVEQAQRRFYGKLLAPESELGRMVQLFYGRLYFNVDQFRHICKLTRTPPAVILRSLGHEGEIDPQDELVPPRSARELVRALPDIIRVSSRQLTIRKRLREQLARTNRYIEELESLDFRQLSDKDLWEKNRKWRPRIIDELNLVFRLAAITVYEKALRDLCKRVGIPCERLLLTYLAAGEKSVSSQQAFDLLRLVQVVRRNGGDFSSPAFESEFKLFLQKYGHRGRYESDVAMPRYVEDPSLLLFTIRTHLESPQPPDPDEIMKRQDEDAAKAWLEFENRLSAWQRVWLAPRARWLLHRVKQFYVWRELVRSEMLRPALPLRRLHLEMARRFVERGWLDSENDYFYLTLMDVDRAVDDPDTGASLRSMAARRKSDWERLSKLDMPLLIRESQLPAIGRKLAGSFPPDSNLSKLRGLCASAGYAESEVIIMMDPSEFSRMKPGAILVAPATDPSWTPLFTLASGVIVEIGGMLSHASTVAREYGLPALANVKNATKILKTGDRVRLDATNGVVHIL